MIPLAEFARSTEFFVIAHRGDSGTAPENTMAAIDLALAAGVQMIEIDVQSTMDNELIVFHDHILGRTTNGHGQVRKKPLAEIQQLDAGSWFSPAFANERVPLFKDVLSRLAGRAYVNIELKPFSDDPLALQNIERLLQTTEEFQLSPYTVFSSFDHDLLRHIKTVKNYYHTCALNVPGDSRLPSEILLECGAQAYGCSTQELSSKRAEDAKKHHIPWGVYTVNTLDQLEKARAMGVSAVVTNFPALMMSNGTQI